MEILHPKNNVVQNFTGYKIDTKAGGNTVKYLLKKKEFQYIDTLSFLTAVTSATGFAVGGAGLLSDYFNDISHGKHSKPEQPKEKVNGQALIPVPTAFSDVSATQKISYMGRGHKEEGAKTIVPNTKFAKIGLAFVKVGIAFSSIAGIFNGISMGLPLMAAGESVSLGASPIIETPLGTGLFHIALAAVFAGRALENDPKLRMDKIKLSQQKGIGKKVLYVLKNMRDCAVAVGQTTKTFGKNIGNLCVKSKRPEAISFFKDSVFSIKPKKIVFQEFVNKDGIVTVKTAFKNNPCLMHAASVVLALGGITLAINSLLKNRKGQKVGLKTCEIGGSFDNLGLSRSGLEKVSTSSTMSGRIAGNLLAVSGLAILAGQPGLDTKWGRGTQWVGTALLFSVFAVERLPKAFKIIAEKSELNSLVRQWEVDLTKMYTKSELNSKIAGSNSKSLHHSIINWVKNFGKPEGVIEDKKLESIFNAVKYTAENKVYNEKTSDVMSAIEKHIEENNKDGLSAFKNAFQHEGNDGIIGEIKQSLQQESDRIFQKD